VGVEVSVCKKNANPLPIAILSMKEEHKDEECIREVTHDVTPPEVPQNSKPQ
jgi:hypothetical protein